MKTKFNIPKVNFPFETYIVGGWVRDKIQNPESDPKDLDLCVVLKGHRHNATALLEIIACVEDLGGKIFLVKEEFLTIRCSIPELGAVDIAVARKDGSYSDGRHPDETVIADCIEDDLKRRDFTAGAIAIRCDDCESFGEIIDPFDGQKDIHLKVIRCVGNASERFAEDSLRMLRAIRFCVTKGFTLDPSVFWAIQEYYKLIENVSTERVQAELDKGFQVDTRKMLATLFSFGNLTTEIFKKENLKLVTTTKQF